MQAYRADMEALVVNVMRKSIYLQLYVVFLLCEKEHGELREASPLSNREFILDLQN